MPVHPPRIAELGRLLDALSSDDVVSRDSASARLILFGTRSTARLQALLANDAAGDAGRIAALRTLLAIDPSAAVDGTVSLLAGPSEPLAREAIALLSEALLDASDDRSANAALEHLGNAALSAAIPPPRRLMAIDALSRLPETLRRPLFASLAGDPDRAIAERAGQRQAGPPSRLEGWIEQGHLPDETGRVLEAINADATLPVTQLRRLIDLVRAREKLRKATDRDDWTAIRGLLHMALARRGSSVALYDLRETLEDLRTPVGANIIAAARQVADLTCLDAIAARWVAATADPWLRDQLEQVFRAVVERGRLSRGAVVLTRLLARRPDAGPLVVIAPRRRPPARQ